MRALVLALLLASAPALAGGAIGSGAIGGAGGNFTGGTLTAPLILDATNTLCSQALSLSFNGDADLGLQRSAANIALFCASGGVVFNGVITLPSLGSCATADIRRAGAANSGFSVSDGTGRPSICVAGAAWEFQSAAIVTPTNSELAFTGVGMVDASATAAGVNLRVASGANAAGEYGVAAGSNAATVNTDTPVFAACNDCDGTPTYPFVVDGAGHLDVNASTPSDFTTGTCTNDTGVGDDFHGILTADCTAQTAIVTFGHTWTATPICWVSDSTQLPTLLSWVESTTLLTITATSGAGSKFKYMCWLP